MAQLPPKSPTMAPWVNEFFEFSAVRRGAHRRSASDSVAFLEGPQEFDRLDDEQLMSMFADTEDDMAAAVGDTKRESDSRSGSEEPQNVKAEPENGAAEEGGTQFVDPKRVKRILANRQSAQRSRVRKLQYISELERSVTTLQMEVSALSPRVAFLDHQRSLLTVGNSHLRQRIAALAQDKIFKDAHQEALKREIERLREVYQQQNKLKKVTGTDNDSDSMQIQFEKEHVNLAA
ncbi:basic leucine zipper 6-like [Carex rostrata]